MPSRLSRRKRSAAPRRPGDAPGEHARELRGLVHALSDAEGFRLVLATYQDHALRDRLIERLAAELAEQGIRLQSVDFGGTGKDQALLDMLRRARGSSASGEGLVLSATGLEARVDLLGQDEKAWSFLKDANFHREVLAKEVPVPMVFWLSPMGTAAFARHAPDLWHWRVATFDFPGLSVETRESGGIARSLSFETARSLPVSGQGERIAALRESVLELVHLSDSRTLTPNELTRKAALLGELGVAYAAAGNASDAKASLDEALGIYRELAAAHPAAYRPNVAGTLNNLGNVLDGLGERDAARKAYEEALAIYLELAAAHPAAYRPDVAMTLNNLGIVLGALGERDAARKAYEEALAIYRELAAERPKAYGANFVTVLRNYVKVAPETGADPWWAMWKKLSAAGSPDGPAEEGGAAS